jgi:purine-binding chemotaxis protein CheW
MTDSNSTLPTINWQELLAELDPQDEARQRQLLQERLQQRAKNYAGGSTSYRVLAEEESYHVLTFSLGAERYAVDVSAVRGVRSLSHITRVPGVPSFYRGVVNVRGKIVSVLDLRYFFNMVVAEDDLPGELILAEAGGLNLAVLAHHIEDVMTIPHMAVEPAEMRYAHGITMGRMVVLDLAALFTDERLKIGGGDDNG